MVYNRRPPEERFLRIEISLSSEQLRKIDQWVTSNRSALIRSIIQDWINQQEVKIRTIEKSVGYSNPGMEYATESDFEITFNAYAGALKKELLACYHDGQNVTYIVPAFARFLREYVKKQAHDEQIRVFLHDKMLEVSNTNF